MSKNRRRCPACGSMMWLGFQDWHCMDKCDGSGIPEHVDEEITEPLYPRKKKPRLVLKKRLGPLFPQGWAPDPDDDDDWAALLDPYATD